jgi:intracellular multiplication protein IcmL
MQQPEKAGLLGTMENIAGLRISLKKSQKTNIALSVALVIAVTLVAALALIRPKPVYFGMTEQMQLMPMIPLSEPLMNDAAIKAWLAKAITDSFNMDFLNWRERLSNARQYFTKEAFHGYALALDSEGHLPLLTQNRAIMHTVPEGTPIIVNKNMLKGVMTWVMEIPVLLNYETSKQVVASQRITVTCRVQRVPTTDYVTGIAISQLVTQVTSVRK